MYHVSLCALEGWLLHKLFYFFYTYCLCNSLVSHLGFEVKSVECSFRLTLRSLSTSFLHPLFVIGPERWEVVMTLTNQSRGLFQTLAFEVACYRFK